MKAVILAGGGGTRLFPLSRTCYPKQFLKIAGQASLLQQTVARFAQVLDCKDIVIVTNADYIFHVQKDLADIGAQDCAVIAEPAAKNTAPAVALAMSYCKDVLACGDDEIVIVSPADHLINPAEAFANLVRRAAEVCAETKYIVTLGIVPTKPETGYGYIQASEERLDAAYKVAGFKEKPDSATAQKYLSDCGYFWNSGMFLFPLSTMAEELRAHEERIAAITARGYEYAVSHFAEMPNISIDYAVAERSSRMAVVPMTDISWSDIGSFDAIADVMRGGGDGCAFDGDVIAQDCKNTLILGSSRFISAIGVSDLVVVDTPDALLLAKRGRSQDVKKIVASLKAQGRKEADENVTMHRPWGSYTVLAKGDGYKVKRITVDPGAKLSLQMHYHRSEHWTVISGTGKVTLNGAVSVLRENESTYIPIGAKHRLENPGKIPLSIIEVQNGKYVDEDDIVRFDDEYGRQEK